MEANAERSDSIWPFPPRRRLRSFPASPLFTTILGLVLLAIGIACAPRSSVDSLSRVRKTGVLKYGGDKEGGGPYIYPDPAAPREVTGFEVELIRLVAGRLGVRAEFSQGQWDTLLNMLDGGRIDVVLNGYEWTPARAGGHLVSRPYYIFQLQLLAPKGSKLSSWNDVRSAARRGRRPRIGVLSGSASDDFARACSGVVAVPFNGATDAMLAASNRQIDATLQDLPAVRFYARHYPNLFAAGPLVGRGTYVFYFRETDESLRDAVDSALDALISSGELRRIYDRYGIWTAAQESLPSLVSAGEASNRAEVSRGLPLLRRYGSLLLDASALTIFLSVASMPLAMTIGLLVALGRLYGPRPLRWLLTGYVELLRGTPLMLQLFVLYFLLRQPALVAGIGGLAINYSAYEAEIYRAGLLSIPAGQMEAALALGMSRSTALRRVILPQAVRVVIPPITNDFIALFKDTSVCSVITITELSKQYQILANGTGGVVEFAAATALLYLAMSLPLSWFSRWSERRFSNELATGKETRRD